VKCFGLPQFTGLMEGTILTPPVRKNHRKAACKMYPPPTPCTTTKARANIPRDELERAGKERTNTKKDS